MFFPPLTVDFSLVSLFSFDMKAFLMVLSLDENEFVRCLGLSYWEAHKPSYFEMLVGLDRKMNAGKEKTAQFHISL